MTEGKNEDEGASTRAPAQHNTHSRGRRDSRHGSRISHDGASGTRSPTEPPRVSRGGVSRDAHQAISDSLVELETRAAYLPACIRMVSHMPNTQNGPSPWLGRWYLRRQSLHTLSSRPLNCWGQARLDLLVKSCQAAVRPASIDVNSAPRHRWRMQQPWHQNALGIGKP